jgi:hypothetical protein
MAKRGLITDADRRSFLEDKYAEMLESDYNKALNNELNTEYFAGNCPYCGKSNRLFENKGQMEHGKHKIIKAVCSGMPDLGFTGCGREVYIIVALKQEGNIFQGIKYVPVIRIIKPEELNTALIPPQLRKEQKPEPVPEKQPSGPGSKFKPPSSGYHHEYRGYKVELGWGKPFPTPPVPQNIKEFAKKFKDDRKDL